MKGRFFPKVNSVFAHNISSYVQINIYDTNLKDLRARGVNLKQFLQQHGCRSVILDVPIVSEDLRKTVASPRRFHKSCGGFSRTGKTRHSNVAIDQETTSDSNKNCTSDEDEKLNDASGEEYVDCCTSFATNAVKTKEHEVRNTVPATSTPLPCKSLKSPASFFNASTIADSSSAIADCNVENTAGSPLNKSCSMELLNSVNTLQSDKEVTMRAENPIICSSTDHPLMESSFVNFQTVVIEGIRSVNDNSTAPSETDLLHDSCRPVADLGAHFDGTKEYDEVNLINEQQRHFHNKGILPLEGHAVQNFCKYGGKTSLDPAFLSSEEVLMKSTSPLEDANFSHSGKNTYQSLRELRSSLQGSYGSDSTEPAETLIKRKSADAANRTMLDANAQKRSRPQIVKSSDRLVSDEPENKDMEQNLVHKNVTKRKLTSEMNVRAAEDERVYECQMPLCRKKLLWRPRYGKNRLVDHVRTHWNKAVKKCKLCDYKASSLRKVHYHHSNAHPGEVYRGALSIESKEDLDELLDLWKKCFPSLQLSTSRVLSFH